MNRKKQSLSLKKRWETHTHHSAGKIPFNKGKTYKELYGEKYAKELKKCVGFAVTGSTGLVSTVEKEKLRRSKIFKTMKGRTGGYRRGSGCGKKGRYKGYWCDSSWELAYVIYKLDKGDLIKRNWEKFTYEYNGEKHTWIPDFKEKDIYIEIKGWETKQVKAKFKSFPYKLEILKERQMKPILEYVINKYGKDFIKLYDKR